MNAAIEAAASDMELRDKVARNVKAKRFERTGRASSIASMEAPTENELLDADAAIAPMQEAGWQDAAFFRKALQSAPIIGMIESAAAFRERQDTWLADEYCKALKDET